MSRVIDRVTISHAVIVLRYKRASRYFEVARMEVIVTMLNLKLYSLRMVSKVSKASDPFSSLHLYMCEEQRRF